MYVLETPSALSTAQPLNNLTFHEYFLKCVKIGSNVFSILCTHIHAHSHTAISEVFAECSRLFPMDKHGLNVWGVLWKVCFPAPVKTSQWTGIF